MTDIYIYKKLGVFHGAAPVDLEKIARLEEGAVYRAKISMPRNVRFHKMYFALLKLVLSNLPEQLPPVCITIPSIDSTTGAVAFEQKVERIEIKTISQLLYQLKILIGHYEERVTMAGMVTIEVKSISFSEMGEVEFQEFVNRSIDVIIKHFLTGSNRQEIIDNITHYF